MLFHQADSRNCAAMDARNASGSPCFRVYLRCHVVDTFFRKRLAFPFYASVTTPYRLTLPLPLVFLLSPFAVFDLLACPLSRYFSMLLRNFFRSSKEFLSEHFRSPCFTFRIFVKRDSGLRNKHLQLLHKCSIERSPGHGTFF